MSYQLVGEVMAHQGYDGYPAWEGDRTHWNWDTEYCSMGETLKQQRRVEDEGFRIVNSFC